MPELSLSKIPTLTDAKLLRNFAIGWRASHSNPSLALGMLRGKKIFVYAVAKCEAFVLRRPLAKNFYKNSHVVFHESLRVAVYNVLRIKEVAEGNLGEA